MYKSFEIQHFRGFQALSLDSFQRVNILTGANNVGKTAVLEALFIHMGAHNPDLTMTINGLRGIENIRLDLEREIETPFDSIFHDYNSTHTIKLSGDVTPVGWEVRLSHVKDMAEISGLKLSIKTTFEKASAFSARIPAKILKLEFRKSKGQAQRYFLILDQEGKKIQPTPPPPPFPARLHLAGSRANPKQDVENFSRIQMEGAQAGFIQSLTLLEPRLRSVEIVMEAGQPMLHGDIGISRRHFIPLAMMGDGVNRLVSA